MRSEAVPRGVLFADDFVDGRGGCDDVLGAGEGRTGIDVVPRPHLRAAVDGHGTHRRMGEDEAQGHVQVQLVDHGLEVVAVGTQAVQPDHGAGRSAGRIDFDAFEGHGASHTTRAALTMPPWSVVAWTTLAAFDDRTGDRPGRPRSIDMPRKLGREPAGKGQLQEITE